MGVTSRVVIDHAIQLDVPNSTKFEISRRSKNVCNIFFSTDKFLDPGGNFCNVIDKILLAPIVHAGKERLHFVASRNNKYRINKRLK